MVISDSEEMPGIWGEDDCCVIDKSSDESGDGCALQSSSSKSKKVDLKKVTKASSTVQSRAVEAVAQNTKNFQSAQALKSPSAIAKAADLSSQYSNFSK